MATVSVGSAARSADSRGRWGMFAPAAVVLLALAACGGTSGGSGSAADSGSSGKLTLYTCVSDEAIQPVIRAFEQAQAGSTVDLFRAPTGELNARVAADARSGGLRADVIWGCDPLTVQAFVDQGLVGGWTPHEADAIPGEFRTSDYVGAHLLYMVAVHRTDVPAPRAWSDLTGPAYSGGLAVPDRASPPRRSVRSASSPRTRATAWAITGSCATTAPSR
jgi:iron(III) transport system substrate-binding protein